MIVVIVKFNPFSNQFFCGKRAKMWGGVVSAGDPNTSFCPQHLHSHTHTHRGKHTHPHHDTHTHTHTSNFCHTKHPLSLNMVEIRDAPPPETGFSRWALFGVPQRISLCTVSLVTHFPLIWVTQHTNPLLVRLCIPPKQGFMHFQGHTEK